MKGPVKIQYYYKVTECKAHSAENENCVCWHDEGTGPFPEERHDDADTSKSWRLTPNHIRSGNFN